MTSLYTEDNVSLPLKVGQSFSRTICLGTASVQLFATLIGDSNPLHHDKEAAARSRFDGIIASGIQTSGILGAMVASKLCSLLPTIGLEVSFRFLRPVYTDVELVAKLELTAIQSNERLGGDVITFSGQLLMLDGTPLVSGTLISLVTLDTNCTNSARALTRSIVTDLGWNNKF